jgi:hypothetical protein
MSTSHKNQFFFFKTNGFNIDKFTYKYFVKARNKNISLLGPSNKIKGESCITNIFCFIFIIVTDQRQIMIHIHMYYILRKKLLLNGHLY